jgi:hypothetical protein
MLGRLLRAAGRCFSSSTLQVITGGSSRGAGDIRLPFILQTLLV